MSFEEPGPEERPFVEAILADPDDDGPRLVYADWLTEQGDPRGEFVQVQCQLASLPMDDPAYAVLETRERELLKQHRARWIKPLPKVKQASWGTYGSFRPGRWHMRRGLVEYATFSKPKAFVDNQALFDEWPIRYVTFLEINRKVAATLPDFPAAERMRGLVLPQRFSDSEPAPEVDGDRFPGLEELGLNEHSLGSQGLGRLLERFENGRLRALDVGFNEIDAEGLDLLTDWSGLSRLRTLAIGLNRRDEGIAPALPRFVASKNVANLHELDLWGNDLEAEHVGEIATAKKLGRLVKLELNDNRELGDRAVELLAESRTLKALRWIELRNCRITNAGAIALAEAETSRRITHLDLCGNVIGDDGAVAMAESPNLANLRILDLSGQSGIGPRGLRAFAESPYMEHVEFLNLGGARFDEATTTALKKRFRKAFTDDEYREPWLK